MTAIEITRPLTPEQERIFSPDALRFVAALVEEFSGRREDILKRRGERQAELDAGQVLDFLPETREVREGEWQVAPIPEALRRRRVEITGPAERKMMINALNSGADVFMADLEDSLSPGWDNIADGQVNLYDAVRRTLEFDSPEGKSYRLNEDIALLLVRPRGWHLTEKHALMGGNSVPASLFDFGLYFYHNSEELLRRGSGPFFYLPKLESHVEARLWNYVFNFAEDALHIPSGSTKGTVLIETILAAYEMDEILYELRDHAAGLNAGRWDYIFSIIKKLRNRPGLLLPDRAQITMGVPFMRAYAQLLVKTCHRRGAHAIGGMAAFIPSRKDAEVNKVALAKVREDKEREAGDGFDGTWVAHPDLVPVALEIFGSALGDRPHQKERMREDVQVEPRDLDNFQIEGGKITEAGLRLNISVALQYLAAWLGGNGAAAINNLMEDAATAEISRAQLWQWVHKGARLDDGRPIDGVLYEQIRDEELDALGSVDDNLKQAAEILDSLVLPEQFAEFLTIPAYERL